MEQTVVTSLPKHARLCSALCVCLGFSPKVGNQLLDRGSRTQRVCRHGPWIMVTRGITETVILGNHLSMHAEYMDCQPADAAQCTEV